LEVKAECLSQNAEKMGSEREISGSKAGKSTNLQNKTHNKRTSFLEEGKSSRPNLNDWICMTELYR
jgi:hypothetical protein